MIIASCELSGRTGHEAGRQLLAQLYLAQTGQAVQAFACDINAQPLALARKNRYRG